MLEHPEVTRTLRTGYPYSPKRQEIRRDPFDNYVMSGDEILVHGDEFFSVKDLQEETIEALELVGATYEIAQ